MIRVQTNGLPNHCYDTLSGRAPEAIETDWEVDFRYPVNDAWKFVVTSQSDTNDVLCNARATFSSYMWPGYDYTTNVNFANTNIQEDLDDDGEPLDSAAIAEAIKAKLLANGISTAADLEQLEWALRRRMEERLQYTTGIALSGAYFYNTMASEESLSESKESIDQCFANVSEDGQLYYNFWSPCLAKGKGLASQEFTPNLCWSSDNCIDNTIEFVLETSKDD